MRVYLHIGLHKTGTTAIQTTLAADDPTQGEPRILYPHAGRPTHGGHSFGHHSLAWALTRSEETPDCWPDLKRELDAAEDEIAVVSSECLDLVTEPEHFAYMRSHLEGHQVTVVAYLRRQDEFLHAHYCTNVLFYGESRSFDEFRRDPPTNPDYRALLEPWERSFGREAMIVRPYERRQLEGGDILTDFAARIGVTLPDDRPAANGLVNRSYPRNVVESARALRLAGTRPTTFAQLRELGWRVYADRRTEADILSPGARRELMAEFAESNEFVARTYVGRGDGRLFEELEFGDEGSWAQRYEAPLGDIAISIRDLRDAFRAGVARRGGSGSIL